MFKNKFSLSVPFFEGNITFNKGVFTLRALLLFAIIYFAINVITNIILGAVLAVNGPLGGVIGTMLGLYIGAYWFCRHFYKKQQRLLTKQEYSFVYKKLLVYSVSIQLLAGLLFFGFYFFLYHACQQAPTLGCRPVIQFFSNFGIDQAIIVGVIAVVLTLLLNAIFLKLALSASLRSIHKQFLT